MKVAMYTLMPYSYNSDNAYFSSVSPNYWDKDQFSIFQCALSDPWFKSSTQAFYIKGHAMSIVQN